jgi:hypothetical protein
LCLHYDISYNNSPLAIFCHVVYATLGFTNGRDDLQALMSNPMSKPIPAVCLPKIHPFDHHFSKKITASTGKYQGRIDTGLKPSIITWSKHEIRE